MAAGGAVVVAVVGAVVGTAFHQADTADVASEVALSLVIGVLAVVGAVVALTMPANRVGWLLLAGAATSGTAEALVGAGEHGVLTRPGSVVGAAYFAAIGPALRGVGMLLSAVIVPLSFRTGGFQDRDGAGSGGAPPPP